VKPRKQQNTRTLQKILRFNIHTVSICFYHNPATKIRGFTFSIVYVLFKMDFQENETQNEPETALQEAGNVDEKQKRNSRKQFRGNKQIYSRLMQQIEVCCLTVL
jgi:hypothetical protein